MEEQNKNIVPYDQEVAEELKKIVEDEKISSTFTNRAKVILALMEQKDEKTIVKEINTSVATVRNIRTYYLEQGMAWMRPKMKERAKQVVFQEDYECEFGLSAGNQRVLMLFIDDYQAGFIMRKESIFKYETSDAGTVTVYGKPMLAKMDKLKESVDRLTVSDMLEVLEGYTYKDRDWYPKLDKYIEEFLPQANLHDQYECVFFSQLYGM